MGVVFRSVKRIFASFQVLLLVILSCVVFGAVLMLIFDELDYLEPTPQEKIILVWHQNNFQQSLE